MKTIIITGAGGFIGRYITEHFLANNWKVIGIDNISKDRLSVNKLSHYYRIHLPNPIFNDILKKVSPDLLIHCAGTSSIKKSMENPSDDFHNNTVLTFELLYSLKTYSPSCKFIFLSSAAVYGDQKTLPIKEEITPSPISHYGFHKLQCEQICTEFANIYNLPIAIARIFSAYGPGLRRQVIWDICIKSINTDHLILEGTGNESRDFVNALDIANSLLIIANNGQLEGEIYNIANGDEIFIKDLVQTVLYSINQNNEIIYQGSVPTGTPRNWKGDISKLKSIGFKPSIPFNEGVEEYSKWCIKEILNIRTGKRSELPKTDTGGRIPGP